MGIEPMTSSLPRKRSTPELRRLIVFKGKSPKIWNNQLQKLNLTTY
jgi:hypothetical protein